MLEGLENSRFNQNKEKGTPPRGKGIEVEE